VGSQPRVQAMEVMSREGERKEVCREPFKVLPCSGGMYHYDSLDRHQRKHLDSPNFVPPLHQMPVTFVGFLLFVCLSFWEAFIIQK
jgi:hypothetical protein